MGDEAYIERALRLAERGRGLVSPNPLVGAVVVRAGEIVGEGWHEGPGKPHAEVVALRHAGDRANDATLYTTLEPCGHFGRTPPCTEAILSSGISRVVSAMGDPNPAVDGLGFARLGSVGLDVRRGIREHEAERQNETYLKHVRTGLPFVTWKVAASLDGKVAASDGSSRWITGEAARADVHRLRGASDAILVGAGTVLADDPSLTVRDPEYGGSPPLRVLVDGRGRVPASAAIFDDSAPTLVVSATAPPQRQKEWLRAGAEVFCLAPAGGGVGIGELMALLGGRDMQGLLLESGPTLAWAFLESGAIDKLVLYVAPSLVGGTEAPGALGGAGFAPIARAVRVEIASFDRVGDDLRVEAYVHRDS